MRSLRLGLGLAVTAALACTDIDTTRNPPPRGTIGEEVYGAFCDRVASLVFPEDLSGDSYRNVCHKTNGVFADQVDETKLPPITDGAVDANGNPVSAAAQQQSRSYALARVGALVRRRGDLVAALDATIPDVLVPVKDTQNPDKTQSCGAPSDTPDQISLGKAVADMLGRFGPLYDDGTMPRSTESLAALMQSLSTSKEAQQALAVFASRVGYRPVPTALGAARPSMSYDKLRDLANATLALISPDATPYDLNAPHDGFGIRIPVPGPANAQLNQVVATLQQEMRTATIDPPPAQLTTTNDSYTDRTILSRPRTNLEALRVVMMAEDPAFGAGASRYIARRDARGFAAVPLVGGTVPAPFVDTNADGLPDVDALGQFVSSSGSAPPSPFFAVDAPTKAQSYDAFDRSLAAGKLLYGYVDTTHTFTASMLSDFGPLVNPDVTQNHESLMYMLGGAYAMLGTRDGSNASQKVYGDAQSGQVTLAYDAFHPEKSPLVDLVYAIGQVLGDSSTDDTLALSKSLMQNDQSDLARLVAAGLSFKDVANKHAEAVTPAKSTFWDEILDVVVKIEQEPGLLEDVLRSTESPQSNLLGGVFANYMQFKDHMSYDRKNLNGPPFDVDTNNTQEMSQAVDRTKPDAGWNRSAFQKFIQLVHDTDGVTACNKEGAVLHAKGVPILGSGDICAGTLALCSLLGTRPFHQCEVFKIDNLAKFYVDSIVGKANLYLRPSVLRNGILGHRRGDRRHDAAVERHHRVLGPGQQPHHPPAAGVLEPPGVLRHRQRQPEPGRPELHDEPLLERPHGGAHGRHRRVPRERDPRFRIPARRTRRPTGTSTASGRARKGRPSTRRSGRALRARELQRVLRVRAHDRGLREPRARGPLPPAPRDDLPPLGRRERRQDELQLRRARRRRTPSTARRTASSPTSRSSPRRWRATSSPRSPRSRPTPTRRLSRTARRRTRAASAPRRRTRAASTRSPPRRARSSTRRARPRRA